jgi:multiple sugar transport system substrate-binding protein
MRTLHVHLFRVVIALVAALLISVGLAQGLVYDTEVVNDGNPIVLEFWTPYYQDVFQSWIDDYQQVHPNVTIELEHQPWGDYWAKLPVALQSGRGPDIFGMHIAWAAQLAPLAAPFPFADEDLEADFTMTESNKDGEATKWFNLAVIHGGVFYDRDAWAEAGYGPEDEPETLEDLMAIAHDLTVREGGRMTRAGFCFQGVFRDMIIDLNYQNGLWNFDETGTRAVIDSDGVRESLAFMLNDVLGPEGTCDALVADDNWSGMAQGRIAMAYAWNWVGGWLDGNTDIDWGWFPMPAPEGAPALGRNNVENTFSVNARSGEAEQAVAFDFIEFVLSSDERVLRYVLQAGGVPTKRSLLDDPSVLANPIVARSIAEGIAERTVYAGAMPVSYEAAYDRLRDAVTLEGTDVDTALAQAQEVADERLDGSGFVAIERSYAGAGAFR